MQRARSLPCPVLASVLVAMLGCGPSLGGGDPTGTGTSTGGSLDASVSSSIASDPSGASSTADTIVITGDTGSTIFDVGFGPTTTADPCDARERCPLPGEAFAEVTGTTPLGEFTGAFAWSGRYSGECGGTGIAIMATIEDFETEVVCTSSFDLPDPSIYLFIYDTFRDGCPVDAMSVLTHTVDGQRVATTPELELTLCEPLPDDGSGRVEGRFTATTDGWNISGTFVAPRCIDLDIACP